MKPTRARVLPVVVLPPLWVPGASAVTHLRPFVSAGVRRARRPGLCFQAQSPFARAGAQLSVGGVLGFACGYAVRRIGQLLLLVIGVEVLALQLMAQRGWVDVKWRTIGRDLSPHVEKDRLQRLLDGIKFKVPFAAAFTAGIYAGIRWY